MIDEWFTRLPAGARAKLRTIIQTFRDTPRPQWNPHIIYPIHGDPYRGLYEIKFRGKNVVYRPLGFFGPARHEFTLVMPAREQGNEFIPRNAPDIAVQRINIVLRDHRSAHEYYI